MLEGRTRGENSTPLSDTGGVAQQPLLLTHLFTPSTLSVRRRRCRRSLSPYPHGFTLALRGHHPRLSMVRLRRRREVRCEDATDAEEER